MTHSGVDVTASMTGNVLYIILCEGWHYCWSRLVTLGQVTVSDVLCCYGKFKFVLRNFRKETWMERQRWYPFFPLSRIKDTTLINTIDEHRDVKYPQEDGLWILFVKTTVVGDWIFSTTNTSFVITDSKSFWTNPWNFTYEFICLSIRLLQWQDDEIRYLWPSGEQPLEKTLCVAAL